jgi:hypothetical protein
MSSGRHNEGVSTHVLDLRAGELLSLGLLALGLLAGPA